MIDRIDALFAPLDRELRSFARRQPGCRALQAHYGIGELTAVAMVAELGDARRFRSSRQAVRYSGLDITVSVKRAYHTLRELGEEALQPA